MNGCVDLGVVWKEDMLMLQLLHAPFRCVLWWRPRVAGANGQCQSPDGAEAKGGCDNEETHLGPPSPNILQTIS